MSQFFSDELNTREHCRSRGKVSYGGIEYVEAQANSSVGEVALPPGDYSAQVHLVAWANEAGSKDIHGKPKSTALPDFVVLLNPLIGGAFVGAVTLETFEE